MEQVKPYISPNEKIVVRTSLIKAYLMCPAFAMFRYFKGLVVMPRSYQTLGGAFHSSVEMDYRYKVKKGRNQKLSTLQDKFHEDFKAKGKQTQWMKDEKPDLIEKEGRTLMLPTYYKKRSLKIDPQYVEEPFGIELPEVNAVLTGTIDLVDTDDEIKDHKTKKRRPNWLEPYKSLQGFSYTAGFKEKFGRLPKGFTLDYVIRKSTHSDIESSKMVKHGVKEIASFREKVVRVIRSIRNGEFYPRPENNYLCNPKTCGFWQTCQIKHQWRNVGPFTKIFGSNSGVDDVPEEE